MRALLGSVVDGKALLDGLGVTVIFALAIVGATRAVDLRRGGHNLEATAYGALAALSALGVAAAVVFAIVVMTNK